MVDDKFGFINISSLLSVSFAVAVVIAPDLSFYYNDNYTIRHPSSRELPRMCTYQYQNKLAPSTKHLQLENIYTCLCVTTVDCNPDKKQNIFAIQQLAIYNKL